ncbi:hypothetical protein ZHAS_00004547 [Anopheles sinensis]|uniref:Uncharacterized protein n=1 Tax=Anopheles sinensis TaxID=74873 RepID=A0A084VHH1_ANOSI|nr:hypothetical protein ZHAS_00004547 [Anopheles sinensis]
MKVHPPVGLEDHDRFFAPNSSQRCHFSPKCCGNLKKPSCSNGFYCDCQGKLFPPSQGLARSQYRQDRYAQHHPALGGKNDTLEVLPKSVYMENTRPESSSSEETAWVDGFARTSNVLACGRAVDKIIRFTDYATVTKR